MAAESFVLCTDHLKLVPFADRWELLRPELKRLFLEEKCSYAHIENEMRIRFDFDAKLDISENQYRYQFTKKWGWKKNLSSKIKDEMVSRAEQLAALGKETDIIYKDRPIDNKKLLRHTKEITRKRNSALSFERGSSPQSNIFGHGSIFRDRIFLQWNKPYAAIRLSQTPPADQPSSFSLPRSIQGGILLKTPPGQSPANAPSPLSVALTKKVLSDRARLFVLGDYDHLIQSLNNRERELVSNWLYQFWLYSFNTAKYWGEGPRYWKAQDLGFAVDEDISRHEMISKPPMASIESLDQLGHSTKNVSPSQLCRWSIHILKESYEAVSSPLSEPYDEQDTSNSMQPWPKIWRHPPFEERLQNNLIHHDFSNINREDIPLAIDVVANTAKRSPDQLRMEALGFAIMGRNPSLVADLLGEVIDADQNIESLHPLHLATSFLDGSKSCCQVFHLISYVIGSNRNAYVNELGHTVLDNLMITILKNHTSIRPGIVDDALRGESHFGSEQVSICGRWDADSECYRALLASGISTIPFTWKHKFCHTSIQAVCHCIELASSHIIGGLLERTPSGLFLKHCPYCDLKLQLLPLHTLVLTAFWLGNNGCEDEDLFGIICCLLSLISCSIDEHLSNTAEISLSLLLGDDDYDTCTHSSLSPLEMAEIIWETKVSNWSTRAVNGWQVFLHILGEAKEGLVDRDRQLDSDAPDYLSDCDFHRDSDYSRGSFGASNRLGHIWAAAQTELLTYRRRKEETPWMSENFDMEALLRSLETKTAVSIPLVQNSMMKSYCPCGIFGDEREYDFYCLRREEAAAYYFSNLDDCARTSIVDDSITKEFQNMFRS